ncbi:hypothetical protein CEUSTIGMA_g3328.t1 [Chlamydomonas eustigma]|uniref:2,4-dienoyl-CoA reductase [(3E)-enoyl-CoA-producing] n=1 Tax=Chlamydomonas eustigma TaxID=1157962 RepID=A0A250WYM4_9CHLO|nr:hypothetical protein CEUSTIGMA_g3328.t1 [Chlamydomonas eustigma]|eukprot:GAX75885.1 hypothetical protein CEUSTIGMA_g3328.t1 [Chlamydomonas eustigma]
MGKENIQSPFKTDTLTQKVALVTGGSSGIGLEIARQLGLHGAIVYITGRRKEVLDVACTDLQACGITACGLQGDVREQASCDRWLSEVESKHSKLDVLVNCAAGNFLVTAEELSQNGFRTVMEIDTVGTFTMCKSAFSLLKQSSSPCIINISATLQYGATWYQVHASAAKAAVDSITRTLALEWGQFGIRVNGVAPGPIEGTAGMTKLGPGDSKDLIVSSIPMGRMGKKWDIGMACVFLSSSAASFISGDTLVVDGANWMWKPPVVPRSVVSKVSRGVEAKITAPGRREMAKTCTVIDLTDVSTEDQELQEALELSFQESQAWAAGDVSYRRAESSADTDFEDQLAMAVAASLETAARDAQTFSSPSGRKHALESLAWDPTPSQLPLEKDLDARLLAVAESELLFLNPVHSSASNSLPKRMKQQASHVSLTEMAGESGSYAFQSKGPTSSHAHAEQHTECSTDTAETFIASYSGTAGPLDQEGSVVKNDEASGLICHHTEEDLEGSLGKRPQLLRSFLRNQKVFWRDGNSVRVAKIESVDHRSAPALHSLEVLYQDLDDHHQEATSSDSTTVHCTAHDLFIYLEAGERVWYPRRLPAEHDRADRGIDFSSHRVSKSRSIVQNAVGQFRGPEKGISTCGSSHVKGLAVSDLDLICEEHSLEAEPVLTEMASGDPCNVEYGVEGERLGMTVWEEAVVVHCDLFHLEPKVVLRSLEPCEMADGASDFEACLGDVEQRSPMGCSSGSLPDLWDVKEEEPCLVMTVYSPQLTE